MNNAALARTAEVMAVMASWPAAWWVLRHGANGSRTISYHGGTGRFTYPVFAASLCGHALVFTWFYFSWLMSYLGLGTGFTILVLVAVVCQFFTGLIPDGNNPRLHAAHSVCAYGMAATMPIMLGWLLTRPLSAGVAAALWLALAVMASVAVTVAARRRATGRVLAPQLAYILSFQICLIALATYA